MMKKIALFVVFALILALCAGIGYKQGATAVAPPGENVVPVYTTHAPIYIDNDNAFSVGTGVVSGKGSSGDPYIIEGWEIPASNDYSFYIQHTTKYFIIRNCLLHNTTLLSDVTNGKIESNYISTGFDGIWLQSSSKNIVTKNIISQNPRGIKLTHSDSNTITNNEINQNTAAIFGEYSNYNTISDNNISNNVGFAVEFQNMAKFNRVHHNHFTDNNVIGYGGRQAVDADGSNFWNTSGEGNWWSEWTGPDNDSNGIVDIPYHVLGLKGSKDWYPIAGPSNAPEFTVIAIIVVFTLAIFIIATIRPRRK